MGGRGPGISERITRSFFGTEPDSLLAIGIQTDTDHSNEMVTAYYSEPVLRRNRTARSLDVQVFLIYIAGSWSFEESTYHSIVIIEPRIKRGRGNGQRYAKLD